MYTDIADNTCPRVQTAVFQRFPHGRILDGITFQVLIFLLAGEAHSSVGFGILG